MQSEQILNAAGLHKLNSKDQYIEVCGTSLDSDNSRIHSLFLSSKFSL